ncbi:MAG: radical SAM family heme chaperone HemW [Methanobacteriota archaeon]|nr:MAG: radical SAM family heme chaperone HemW [Euryarchaeota archaeon]
MYIHIPFCQEKCGYCDFYSITQLDLMDEFVEALLSEIELRAPQFSGMVFTTLYMGGGTPSLLWEEQLQHIWEALHRNFSIESAGEFTIEANPGTLSPSKLTFFKSLGFNRLSMGVQSFNPDELRFLGRIHSVEEVYENFHQARAAGFKNINIDLMTAFPGITPQSFNNSLTEVVRLRPEHVSCYTLIFEPGTQFYKRMKAGELHPLTDEEEASYYLLAKEILGEVGYTQYEISNFALGNEYFCQHNLVYWSHQPYLGLGPSAHSFFENTRTGNKRSVMAYINMLKNDQLPIEFVEDLTPEQLMFEYIFLRLRLRQGVSIKEFQRRFGISIFDKYGETLQRLEGFKLIRQDGNFIRLTEKGWMVADTVATYF